MATRSIYHKTCPACTLAVELDAPQCSCGYSFELSAVPGEAPGNEQALQDEELLKEYLVARFSQAVAELETVQGAVARDPKNLDAAGKLMRAFTVVREMRTELEKQAAKVEELKKSVQGLHAETDSSGVIATAVPATQVSAEFRAAQAAKAEKIMHAAGMHTKECPKCHAVLPERAALCFCGNAFAHDRTAASTPAIGADLHPFSR